MIFYIATDTDGKKHVLTVKTEAEAIDKNFVEIDQPNDKKALQTLIQESFDTIYDLEQQISRSAPAEGSDGSQEQVPDVASESPMSRQAETSVRPAIQSDWTATQIEEFLLNQATMKQVENIFSCFGTRFREFAEMSLKP
jgi:hypothetical protein